jgi:leukotriene-A4 hydrolase
LVPLIPLQVLLSRYSRQLFATLFQFIAKVSNQTNSGAPHAVFGTPVSVKLAGKALRGETVRVKIDYETSPDASAIQWLAPVQTKGGKHPYLFTQCQAIHARSMLPCQDAPSVKATYDAKVSVPKDLVALMSAERGEVIENGDKKTYCFSQKIGISSYLIALAVGALVSRDIGPRSKVWSEAEMVEAGAYEFAETEKFISIAEEIVGKYVWGTYDVLLLPPSFPYGGMENPMLTFVTPTLLAGDR